MIEFGLAALLLGLVVVLCGCMAMLTDCIFDFGGTLYVNSVLVIVYSGTTVSIVGIVCIILSAIIKA